MKSITLILQYSIFAKTTGRLNSIGLLDFRQYLYTKNNNSLKE